MPGQNSEAKQLLETITPGHETKETTVNPLELLASLATRNEDGEKVRAVAEAVAKLLKGEQEPDDAARQVINNSFTVRGSGSAFDSLGNNTVQDVVELLTSLLKKLNETNDNSERLAELLNALKQLQSKVGRALREARKLGSTVNPWLLDTCYDKERAKRLANALEEILATYGGSKKKGAALLAFISALYSAVITKPGEYWRAEWLLSLLRARAKAEDENIVFPTCPGRGDAAALYYAALLLSPDVHGKPVEVIRWGRCGDEGYCVSLEELLAGLLGSTRS